MSKAIEVTLTNESREYQFSHFVEVLDDEDVTMGDVYKMAQAEYGRCQSKVYIDTSDGPPKHVGWFFISRQEYEDTHEPYLRGAWIVVGEHVPAVPEHVVN